MAHPSYTINEILSPSFKLNLYFPFSLFVTEVSVHNTAFTLSIPNAIPAVKLKLFDSFSCSPIFPATFFSMVTLWVGLYVFTNNSLLSVFDLYSKAVSLYETEDFDNSETGTLFTVFPAVTCER